MLSPHAILRERAIFVATVEADRARRLAGKADPEGGLEPVKPFRGRSLTDEMRATMRQVVQARYFTGG